MATRPARAMMLRTVEPARGPPRTIVNTRPKAANYRGSVLGRQLVPSPRRRGEVTNAAFGEEGQPANRSVESLIAAERRLTRSLPRRTILAPDRFPRCAQE